MNKELFKSLEQLKEELNSKDDYYCLQSEFLKKYETAIINTIIDNKDYYIDKTNKIVTTWWILLFISAILSMISLYYIPLLPIFFILFKKQMRNIKNEFDTNVNKIGTYRKNMDNIIKEKHNNICKNIKIKKETNKDFENKYNKAKEFIDNYINGNIDYKDIDSNTLKIIIEILKEELNTEENDIKVLLEEIRNFYKNNDNQSLTLKYE